MRLWTTASANYIRSSINSSVKGNRKKRENRFDILTRTIITTTIHITKILLSSSATGDKDCGAVACEVSVKNV